MLVFLWDCQDGRRLALSGGDCDSKGIRRKEKADVSNPIMIFPNSNKYMQSYQEPYFELFTKFQELLKRPDTLFILQGLVLQITIYLK